MRNLSFLLRLHALPPLARFSRTPRKPYLPLEVRYLIRPSEEVFLYVSNAPDNRTSFDDLFLLASERFEINTFIPSTGNIPLLLKFLPMPAEGIYSYLTNDYAFLGMLCRRGLACHYLASRYCNLSDFTFRGEEKREEEKPPHLHSVWFLLLSAALSALLLFGGYWLSNIEISREVFWILFLLISWLGGTFMIFTIIIQIMTDELDKEIS